MTDSVDGRPTGQGTTPPPAAENPRRHVSCARQSVIRERRSLSCFWHFLVTHIFGVHVGVLRVCFLVREMRSRHDYSAGLYCSSVRFQQELHLFSVESDLIATFNEIAPKVTHNTRACMAGSQHAEAALAVAVLTAVRLAFATALAPHWPAMYSNMIVMPKPAASRMLARVAVCRLPANDRLRTLHVT